MEGCPVQRWYSLSRSGGTYGLQKTPPTPGSGLGVRAYEEDFETNYPLNKGDETGAKNDTLLRYSEALALSAMALCCGTLPQCFEKRLPLA